MGSTFEDCKQACLQNLLGIAQYRYASENGHIDGLFELKVACSKCWRILNSQYLTSEELREFMQSLESAQTAFKVAGDVVQYVHVIGHNGFKPNSPKNEAIATLRQFLTSSIANVQQMISIWAAEASVVHENGRISPARADMSTLLRRMKELNGTTRAY
jgi:hypothetical protein